MRRKTFTLVVGALLLAATATQPARADVDAVQVAKRKELIHSCLLSIYIAQKKRPQALSEYQIMVGLKPEDARMRFNYGRYIAAGGTPADVNKAIAEIKKAVQQEPSNPEFNGALGSLYLKAKNPNEALKWLRIAVQYGGKDYQKYYEETQKFIDYEKKVADQKKKQEEYKKKVQEQKQQQIKKIEDDDDW